MQEQDWRKAQRVNIQRMDDATLEKELYFAGGFAPAMTTLERTWLEQLQAEKERRSRPKGRSAKELRAIIDAEDARRADLMDAWANLTEDAQVELVFYARGLVAMLDNAEVAATREP